MKNKDKLLAIGIEYDIDNFISEETIDGILNHIYDRQILRWTELRYEYMISLQDKQTKKNVKL